MGKDPSLEPNFHAKNYLFAHTLIILSKIIIGYDKVTHNFSNIV